MAIVERAQEEVASFVIGPVASGPRTTGPLFLTCNNNNSTTLEHNKTTLHRSAKGERWFKLQIFCGNLSNELELESTHTNNREPELELDPLHAGANVL